MDKTNKVKTTDDSDEETPVLDVPKYHNYKDVILNYDELKKTNISKAIMTKYEYTKIVGIRAEELARGAKPLITPKPGVINIEDIAQEELNKRKTPFILRRKINNQFEYWKIEDLDLPFGFE